MRRHCKHLFATAPAVSKCFPWCCQALLRDLLEDASLQENITNGGRSDARRDSRLAHSGRRAPPEGSRWGSGVHLAVCLTPSRGCAITGRHAAPLHHELLPLSAGHAGLLQHGLPACRPCPPECSLLSFSLLVLLLLLAARRTDARAAEGTHGRAHG